MIREKYIVANNMRLHVFTAGEAGAPPVILLHGSGVDAALLSWREAIQPLGEHFQVFAPDLPGYGESQSFRGIYTTDGLIETLSGLMDALELQSASLVGLSMGGAVALGYTLAYPARVDRLVLVDAYGLQRKAPFHSLAYLVTKMPWLYHFVYHRFRRSRWLVRMAVRGTLGKPSNMQPEMVDEVFEVMQNREPQMSFASWQLDELSWRGVKTCYADRLSLIENQTLIIHGEKDRVVPLADARLAAQRIQNVRLVTLPDTGHWLPREQPVTFNRILIDFLREMNGRENSD